MKTNLDLQQTNSIAEFTERFINQTNQTVFLTGKAGTGKTTLLKKIIDSTHKKVVIVAPTGIAALNAGGVTIHSFFQLPFGGFLPDFTNPILSGDIKLESKNSLMRHVRMQSKRASIIRSLELLIIDEVSMLRADILDAIDWVLRNVRKTNKPFGGVQVLFIGDLYQLPPVVKDREWQFLKNYYDGAFFFHAKILKEKAPVYIELDKVFRQSDEEFIRVLNSLRMNKLNPSDLMILNKHVKKDLNAKDFPDYITLTTHNATADKMNHDALNNLSGNVRSYHANIKGNFPENIYPIDPELKLKIGSQVMFIKNDLSPNKDYFNGKIGRVTSLEKDEITVWFPDENKTIKVNEYEWDNIRYELNELSGEIEEKILGTFIQYPLKLAWAITVHKSQGLTFDKAIIDVSRVFLPGQAYVALSRLRSLNGLVLMNPIEIEGISNGEDVLNLSRNKPDMETLHHNLELETKNYVFELLTDSYDWVDEHTFMLSHQQGYTGLGPKSKKGKNKEWFNEMVSALSENMDASRKFRMLIEKTINQEETDLEFLNERTEAAYNYFFPVFDKIYYSILKKMFEIELLKSTKQYMEELQELSEIVVNVVWKLKKSKLILSALNNGKVLTKETVPTNDLQQYKIVKLSLLKDEMRRTGFKADTEEEEGFVDVIPVKKKKEKRVKNPDEKSTYEQTLDLFLAGKSVDEIAEIRSLVTATIESHLARLVKTEKLEIHDVIDKGKLNELKMAFTQHEGKSISQIKEINGNKYSWLELKTVQAYLLR